MTVVAYIIASLVKAYRLKINKITKGKTMTVVAYIIASLVKAYRLKKEAKRMENIVRAAGFAY